MTGGITTRRCLLDLVMERAKWAYVSPVSTAQIYLGLGVVFIDPSCATWTQVVKSIQTLLEIAK